MRKTVLKRHSSEALVRWERPNAGLVPPAEFIAVPEESGLTVVAEGTETLEEVNELLALDCEYAQGYFFSRPVDEASAAHLLRTGYCSQKPSSRVATAELPSLPIRSPRLLIT